MLAKASREQRVENVLRVASYPNIVSFQFPSMDQYKYLHEKENKAYFRRERKNKAFCGCFKRSIVKEYFQTHIIFSSFLKILESKCQSERESLIKKLSKDSLTISKSN